MARANFTPGPWETSKDGRGVRSVGLVDPERPERGKELVAEVWREANANLIAAAPDLYAALEFVDTYYSGSLDHQPPYVAIARTALAKARAGQREDG